MWNLQNFFSPLRLTAQLWGLGLDRQRRYLSCVVLLAGTPQQEKVPYPGSVAVTGQFDRGNHPPQQCPIIGSYATFGRRNT